MEKKRKAGDYAMLAIKGLCMGAADVIPGVSGGTIAFLTGIYGELINSIKSIDMAALKMLFSLRLKDFWKKINGNFLVSVVLGILISVFSLAKLMQYLLEYHPVPLWSFFFGLIVASAIYILKNVAKWKVSHAVSLIAGIAAAAYICMVTPGETTEALWFVFLSGVIAICAMILPGISGSFILLLLGKYEFIMAALSELDIIVLAVFASGCVIGIIAFSHVLSWLLDKFYTQTICVLSGFMIGSLLKVWPWKETLASGVERVIGPEKYEIISGHSPEIASAIAFFIIGAAMLFAIEYIVVWMNKRKGGISEQARVE